MLLPTHFVVDVLVAFGLDKSGFLRITTLDWFFIFGSNLIDLDHFWSRPIYKAGRNSFRTHFIHQSWLIVLTTAILMLFWRPLIFLGIGLILHFVLDFIDVARRKIKIFKARHRMHRLQI